MRRVVRLLAQGLCLSAALLVPTVAAGQSYGSTVVASGLNDPRGLAFGPDGALYIAESGYAVGDDTILNNGSITRVAGGSQSRIVTGLPSIQPGEDVTGPQDIAFGSDGTGYVVVGLGTNPSARASEPSTLHLGSILTFTGGAPANFADVSAYEAANNPVDPAMPPDSNPFHLAATADGLLVTDSGANTLLRADASGQVSLVAAFQDHPVGPPVPSSQSVPTGVAVGPDGTIYVAELTGFPFSPGAANIYTVPGAGGTPSVYATGLTDLTDIAFGADGSLYALEYDLDGITGPNVGGGFVRIGAGGATETLLDLGTALPNPTGLTIGPDGAFYVTINSSGAAGSGAVVRIAPVAEPTSWALMIAGFSLVGIVARRRVASRVVAQTV